MEVICRAKIGKDELAILQYPYKLILDFRSRKYELKILKSVNKFNFQDSTRIEYLKTCHEEITQQLREKAKYIVEA